MVSFHLTSNQRTELTSRLPHCHEVPLFRRIQSLLWLDDGDTVPSVARRQGISEQSVHNWIHRFQDTSLPPLTQRLVDKPPPGRPPKLTRQVEGLMEGILATSPTEHGYAQTSWTAELLRFHLQEAHKLSCSTSTVRRALNRKGYSWKRPRYTLNRRPHTWRQKKGGSKRTFGIRSERFP